MIGCSQRRLCLLLSVFLYSASSEDARKLKDKQPWLPSPGIAPLSKTISASNGKETTSINDGNQTRLGFGDDDNRMFTRSDVQVSAMLIGAITFVVCLFHLVNWPDDDIRLYSMDIISVTISIFTAVLMFQGINQFLEYAITDLWQWTQCTIQFLHCAIYIPLMQITIGYFSGMIGELKPVNLKERKWTIFDGLRSDFGRELADLEICYVRNRDALKSVWIDPFGVEVAVQLKSVELDRRKRMMRCWGMLLAHMSGFAAINAGGTMQHMEIFARNPLMALIPVIIMPLFLQVLFFLSDMYRDQKLSAATCEEHVHRVNLCRHHVVEGENDVSSLAVSFLAVQVLRFAVCGVLPDVEGVEDPEQRHWNASIIALFLFGIVFTVFAVLLASAPHNNGNIAGVPGEGEGHDEHHILEAEEDPIAVRLLEIGTNTFAMSFAWSFLFGIRWVCVKAIPSMFPSLIGRVSLALVVSIFSGAVVFLLDAIDDSFRARGNARAGIKAIRTIISAVAILVGFSWEHCFDGSVAAVASTTKHRAQTKLLLGLFVFIVLVPAWRSHILTKVMALEDLKLLRAHSSKRSPSKKTAHTVKSAKTWG